MKKKSKIKLKPKHKVSKIRKIRKRKNPDFIEQLENLVTKVVEVDDHNNIFSGILRYISSYKMGYNVVMFKVYDPQKSMTMAFFPEDVKEIKYPDGYLTTGRNFGNNVRIIIR